MSLIKVTLKNDLERGSKLCTYCQEIKDLSQFKPPSKSNPRFSSQCRKCRKNKRKSTKKTVFEIDGKSFKKCSKCQKIKEIDEFHKCSRSKIGIQCRCKECHGNYRPDYKDCDPEIWRAYRRKYHIKNKDKVRKRNKENYKKNKDKIKIYLHKPEIKERRRKQHNEYSKKRRKEDSVFRMVIALRNCVRSSIKKRHGNKGGRTILLIGCKTWKDARDYVESLWLDGMNWNNYGNKEGYWSLDHIIPLELFDLTQYNHQFVAFNYKNMQPLWHLDNVVKADTLPDGRRARDLTQLERQEYLTKLGYGFLFE